MNYLASIQKNLDGLGCGKNNLEDYGFIIILEQSDDVRNLSEVGLNPCDSGLLGCNPEVVEVVRLDNKEYYRFVVVYNNTFAVTFYSAVGIYNQEVED